MSDSADWPDWANCGGLDPRIGIGLGVIDVEVNSLETPDTVAGRIEEAVNLVGENRIT